MWNKVKQRALPLQTAADFQSSILAISAILAISYDC